MIEEIKMEILRLFGEVSGGLTYVASSNSQVAITLKELSSAVVGVNRTVEEVNRDVLNRVYEQDKTIQKISFAVDNSCGLMRQLASDIRNSQEDILAIQDKIETEVIDKLCVRMSEILDKKLEDKFKFHKYFFYIIFGLIVIIGALVGAKDILQLFLK
jgi:hypothetical protein